MKNLLLLFVLLFAVIMMGCDKNDEKTGNEKLPGNEVLCVTGLTGSNCLNNAYTAIEDEEEIFYAKLQANILQIEHRNLSTNCDYQGIKVSAELIGDSIIIAENELGEGAANCICLRNISFSLNDIKKGTYIIKLSFKESLGEVDYACFTVDLEKSDIVSCALKRKNVEY
ncbi:hypothetical protein HCG69_00595 [Bacteroides sp. K03]|uniref:hypothetical protein n=1 Tax=Bacteroides sp. K03 TaxID=2718928 RepID=UPI001C8B0EA6|nr:hypothetical protein [Bacteroides sp. K03]MBX9186593.1 hypothetical protein [Bacteroides sp. K03]